MKRIFVLALTICIILGCTACGTVTEETKLPQETDAAGNEIEITHTGTKTTVENMPCPVEYNGSTLYLKSVEFYEDYSDNTHEYTLFAVVTFDVSGLTETEIHWLTEEDMDVRALYNTADDGFEFEHLSKLGCIRLVDTQELIYVLSSLFVEDARHSFSGKSISVICNVTQEEKYLGEDGKESEIANELAHRTSVPENMLGSSAIEQPLYSHMAAWIDSLSDFYGSFG